MRKTLLVIVLFVIAAATGSAQPSIYWQNVYALTVQQPMPTNMILTSDSGFILTEQYFGITKLDKERNLQWQQVYGNFGAYNATNDAYSILETPDGYIAVGCTDSTNANSSGWHGRKDYWVVKMNKLGAIQWQKCYGGPSDDIAYSIVSSGADGGFLVSGQSYSTGGQVTGSFGNGDIWVMRIDSVGTLLWEKCYGGSQEETSNKIISTNDGNFAFIGITTSFDGQVTGNHGSEDVWLVKINPAGTILWENCYGGSSYDDGFGMIESRDHGFILSCQTYSTDGQVTGDHDNFDIWIVKTDSAGNLIWENSLGGSNEDDPGSVVELSSGDIFVGGFTMSDDGDVINRPTTHSTGYDFWAVDLNSTGVLQWQKCFGGSGQELDYFFFNEGQALLTADGGIWCSMSTQSSDGDVLNNPNGYQVLWLIELKDGVATAVKEVAAQDDILAFPNPASNYIIIRDSREEVVTFTDILGRNISSLRTSASADIPVDVSQFPSVFFIRSERRAVKKVVRE